MDLRQSTRKQNVFMYIFVASVASFVPSLLIFGFAKQRHSMPKICILLHKRYHKTKDLTDSDTPNRDESAVLASPTSSTCSPVPAICITPEMIAINIFIEQKAHVIRKKGTKIQYKIRTSFERRDTRCSYG